MDKYEQAEQKGRQAFTNYCNTILVGCKINKFSKDKYSKWDVSYFFQGQRILGEIKFRNFDSNAFKNWYLEKDKLEALESIREALNGPQGRMRIHYINIHTDEAIRIYDISNLTGTQLPEEQMMNANTTESIDKKRYKKVYSLNSKHELPESIDIRMKTLYPLEDISDNNEPDGLPF